MRTDQAGQAFIHSAVWTEQRTKHWEWVVYLVEVLEGEDDLSDVDTDLVLGEAVALVQMREQLAATHKVYNTTVQTMSDKKTSYLL